MGRARVWISVGCALALVLAGAALGAIVDRQTRGDGGCATGAVVTDDHTPGRDDVLLTDEPWDDAVSVHIGQRLLVVLSDAGIGGWLAVSVDGAAIRLVATVGAYDYRCHEQPPAAELAIVRAETSGSATLSSGTDAACRHVRLPCTIPQRMWRRTVTVMPG